ncbi:MAG: hypothetical protein ACLPUT_02025 [Solirubrobacteraceae bacterium]
MTAFATRYGNPRPETSAARDVRCAGRTERTSADGLSSFDGAQLDPRIG